MSEVRDAVESADAQQAVLPLHQPQQQPVLQADGFETQVDAPTNVIILTQGDTGNSSEPRGGASSVF